MRSVRLTLLVEHGRKFARRHTVEECVERARAHVYGLMLFVVGHRGGQGRVSSAGVPRESRAYAG